MFENVNFNEVLKNERDTVEIDNTQYEIKTLEPKIYDIPDYGKVEVYGDPLETAEILDDHQGDNIFDAKGNCGLVSIMNILRISGMEVDEDEIVFRAIVLGLCDYSTLYDPAERGGSTLETMSLLLESYGVENDIFTDKDGNASLESIAEYVENGQGVEMAVNCGYSWGYPEYIGDGRANHSIIVTGTVRDAETGELLGLYVCDSGRTDIDSGALFLSVDDLQAAYVEAGGSGVVVTAEPIR